MIVISLKKKESHAFFLLAVNAGLFQTCSELFSVGNGGSSFSAENASCLSPFNLHLLTHHPLDLLAFLVNNWYALPFD